MCAKAHREVTGPPSATRPRLLPLRQPWIPACCAAPNVLSVLPPPTERMVVAFMTSPIPVQRITSGFNGGRPDLRSTKSCWQITDMSALDYSRHFLGASIQKCRWIPCPAAIFSDEETEEEGLPAVIALWSEDQQVNPVCMPKTVSFTWHLSPRSAAAKRPSCRAAAHAEARHRGRGCAATAIHQRHAGLQSQSHRLPQQQHHRPAGKADQHTRI